MASKVGSKGQVVIEKRIRDHLGIFPGWLTLQMLVDDHVELYFVPPPHRQSLKGVLGTPEGFSLPQGEEWEAAREKAWRVAAEEQEDVVERSA